jgi:4-hydroxyproline epimerase
VTAELRPDGEIAIRNVVSYRYAAGVCIDVPSLGQVQGDIAYGGNWFFIVHRPTFDISIGNADELNSSCWRIRRTLAREGITGEDGAEIDHVELEGAPTVEGAHSRNFVQCPGGAYDRSPCGTGTSAKMACLHAAGKLPAGTWLVQESTTGSVFRGRVEAVEGGVVPTIVGRAHITAETTMLFSDEDPIRWGLSG